MLNGILNWAESLGNMISGGSGSDSKQSSKKTKSLGSNDYVCFEILPYKENEFGHTVWEGFLANFSSVSDSIYFSVQGNIKTIKLYMFVPKKMQNYVENTFYASFTTSEIKKRPGKAMGSLKKRVAAKFAEDTELHSPEQFNKGGSYVDPFKDVLSLFFSIPEGAEAEIVYKSVFKVKLTKWQKFAKFVTDLINGFKKKEEEEGDKDKDKKTGKEVKFSFSLGFEGLDDFYQKELQNDMVHSFDKFIKEGGVSADKKGNSISTPIASFVNFFHIPTKANQNKSLSYVEYRKLPNPVNVPTLDNTEENDITILGTTQYKGDGVQFGIRREDKFRHIYIVGKTGMGKSTFISNLVRSDMLRENGIAVVDPHGDLVEDTMAHIPSHRTNDVIVFDVSDTDNPVGFNILEYNSPDEKNLVASAVVSIFKKLFAHSRGPRLEYVLRNVMLSILDYPNATMMHVIRMLTDQNFREEVLTNVTDPVVMKFWRDEYDKWQDKQKTEAVGPIANKIGQFLSSPIVRNIFAQPKSSLKIREAMDNRKILLINLSKGKIGEDNASMIGSFLVSKFQIDAMSRADTPAKERKDFYLYIDEFQNFATDSFESILSEARKYRLSLIVANQYTSQIQENVRNAIFGNVGTIVTFGLGYDDATMMSQQFKEMVSPNDLLSIPKFKAYVKLMVDGIITDPFTMGTLPLPDPELSESIKEKIRMQSRQRYGMPREKLEELLKVWMNKKFTKAEKVTEKVAKNSLNKDGKKFSLNDIKLGVEHVGYVKLKYNYGLFVTVKGVEGLLHKSQIKVPENLDGWKDIYTIGDQIKVKASEFKEINGEKRVVWTQL